jgi:hypothetical protein
MNNDKETREEEESKIDLSLKIWSMF